MTTAAKTNGADSSHWYYTDGRPCYELPKKDGSGMKVPTLADARKLNLLPSVTTILKCLHKQALVEWMIEQACLAVLTSPRVDGEELDAFVYRILHSERVQDQESQAARDRGTQIHAALELMFQGRAAEVSSDLLPWVKPAFDAISTRGATVGVEKIVVGNGYAGKLDLLQRSTDGLWLWDWKTTKKLPDPAKGGAWSEHRLQLAAYAQAVRSEGAFFAEHIHAGNVYVSTIEQGKISICEHGEWLPAYVEGFNPLVQHWQWANRYYPSTIIA